MVTPMTPAGQPQLPVKPVYGVMDFNAQLVLPMSQNPPVQPMEGSVYIDLDDHRIYAFVNGSWRASQISAVPGVGIVFTVDDVGVTTISAIPPVIPPGFVPYAGPGITLTPNSPTAGVTTIAAIPPVIPPPFQPVAGPGINLANNTPSAGYTTISATAATATKVIAGAGTTVVESPPGTFKVDVAPPIVQTLSLISPWTADVGSTPQRMKAGTGAVQLRGQVTAPGPIGKPITVLPSGWRPAVQMMSICVGGSGQQNITIDPDGTVTVVNGTGSPTRLGGIIFIADGS